MEFCHKCGQNIVLMFKLNVSKKRRAYKKVTATTQAQRDKRWLDATHDARLDTVHGITPTAETVFIESLTN